MKKTEIRKEDGRYLIYYSFDDEQPPKQRKIDDDAARLPSKREER